MQALDRTQPGLPMKPGRVASRKYDHKRDGTTTPSQLGVFLSIDDFGTSSSSLRYLRKLPARPFTIDSSVILDLETSADARVVVGAVVRLGARLGGTPWGLGVTAKGVEAQGQRDIPLQMQCDGRQGFFFARPCRPRP